MSLRGRLHHGIPRIEEKVVDKFLYC
jgi:hypothetical protein